MYNLTNGVDYSKALLRQDAGCKTITVTSSSWPIMIYFVRDPGLEGGSRRWDAQQSVRRQRCNGSACCEVTTEDKINNIPVFFRLLLSSLQNSLVVQSLIAEKIKSGAQTTAILRLRVELLSSQNKSGVQKPRLTLHPFSWRLKSTSHSSHCDRIASCKRRGRSACKIDVKVDRGTLAEAEALIVAMREQR